MALAACATSATPAAPTKAPEPANPPAPTSPLAPAATPTPRPATLKFGTPQVIADAGVYIAIEKGYFKEQGITMEVVNFRTVAELIAPLGTGQLDVAARPPGVARL